MDFIVPSLCIATITYLSKSRIVEEIFSPLLQLEEYLSVVGFHQQFQKEREKAWHDIHIKQKQFQVGDLVLLYDSNFMQHPINF
jgi:hypothetical protein